MTALSRRPSNDPHRKGWRVFYGDVQIGHIGERAGVPIDVDQWGWSLSFYPGTEPDDGAGGTGATFEECRAAFERAWEELRPKLTEENFEVWRRERDRTAWKYRMHDLGLPMPTQTTTGWSKCFCGADIPISCEEHIHTVHRGIGE
ncbi:hypothetical protein [Bradyrhizobium ottawaense]|uniref:Uncharacterized protein n=1 Tax=Bradyrhizobium ottawaense TaxID=931866 RepID=A0ABY0QH85_9BRAD|nr:hypothetical protein [Bradyrhizobium ottawaense]SDK42267.1 hypothetical protein SAMN05444163_8073 [Bradyrhizobium ottawaense]